MRSRSSILLGILLVILASTVAFGAPEFQAYLPSSVNLNPEDQDVLVHEIRAEDVMTPVRIKEVTLKNLGTASSNELERIKLRYRKNGGSWQTVPLTDLSGVNSGITFSLPDDGLTLEMGEIGEFRFLVSVAGPDRVPVSKYGEAVSLQLAGMLHYVYLDGRGEAVESVSSSWVEDPGVDKIPRAGFEVVESRAPDEDILQPGTTPVIGDFVFRDDDINSDGVEVDLIKISNRSGAQNPVVLGQDITELTLEVRIKKDEQVRERTISRKVSSPTTEVAFPTEPGGWWDGSCQDGCEVSIKIKGLVSAKGPVQGMELRTGIALETKENNGMSGYPFRQRSSVPEAGVQSVVVQGLESIEEVTDWRSGVINRGETYTQRLVLSDRDRDEDDFVVNKISLRNEGTLDSSGVEAVSVYRVSTDGELKELASGLSLTSDWQVLTASAGRTVPDDGRSVFEVRYEISEDAETDTSFQPVVQFRGSEGGITNAPSPVHTSPEPLTIYPYGPEIVEARRGYMGGSPISGREGVIGQRIDIMDRDENRLDLLINPIVIKNAGTATGSDFRKLELYDSDGNLLETVTDLNGLSTAGITLDDLDGKTTVTDSQTGNWRTFYIYLVPKPGMGQETLNLQTTLYATEGEEDVVVDLQGPSIRVGSGGGAPGGLFGGQPDTTGTEETEALDQPFGFGFAAGTSYPEFPSLGAKLFLEVPLDELGLSGDQGLDGNAFSRFGFEVDSLPQSGYYYPNLSLGYKWPFDTGVNQFIGAGGGAVFLPGLSDTFGVHGVYGVTTTELFEEDIPLLLQAQLKYINEPISETVLGVNLGVLFS